MTLHEPAATTVEEGSHLSKYIRYVLAVFLNAVAALVFGKEFG